MKRIIVWITVLTLIVTGVFAMNACGKRTDKDGISYQLNVSNFDGITTYGEPMDLSRITITRTENGVSTEVPVEASMVTSHVDTSRVGAHILKFNYSGQSFNLPVIVKYKLQFLVDGDVYQSVHVLNRAELGEVVHLEKPGYNFVGWSTEIPGVIADNMTFHAVYEPIIPTLSEIQATYGDNLAAINLPYTVIGQWKFDAPEGTVGNVGKHTFPVSFVEYATGAVLATDTLTVNVAKKTVVFSDVVESFVYNGAVQKPTFKTDVVPQEGERFEIVFFETPGANYTDAGTYDYYFEVDADNYEGALVGTYEIKRAAITVKINSYEMVAGTPYPTVEYQLLGIGDVSAEAVAQLIGLSVTQPEDIVAGAGVYTLTATASNPNVILNVQEGTLTVQSSVLDVADPVLEQDFAIYEDTLADVLFKDSQNGNGTWSWKYPDTLVGDVGIQEHIAVFTPRDLDKYDVIERTVQIKVEKKELIIEIVGKKEFDYNGQEHTLSYIIKDANGKQYESFTVLENPAYINAGEHSITLKFEHQNYKASDVSEKLKINKINPDTVFDKVVLTGVWNPNLTLGQIALPTSDMGQYTWVVDENQTPGDIALSAGSKPYKAVFTPYDEYKTNYNSVPGQFTLEIEQATAKIEGVKDHYDFTYNKNAFVLEGITTNHTVSELAVEYKLNGQKVDSILNAGEYVVTFTLPATTNYKEAVVTATVTVAKADAGKPTVDTAAFGDLLLNVVKFPENNEGNWTIELDATTNANENTKVGSVGEHKFVAVFTPTTENYNFAEVEITVKVAKKKIDVPQISGTNKSQVYTGALLNSGLASAEGYTVEDIGGTTVGTYKAKVVLDTTSYEWNDPNVQSTFEAEYSITPATNAWTTQPVINSWVYGQAGNNGSASAVLGDVKIEYKLASADDSTYTTVRPTNAGKYVARFTVVYANYFDLVQTCAFTIEKQTVNVPEYTKDYVYNGSPITVDIPTSNLYDIANHTNTDVRAGGYLASLTLTDSANYKWSNSESATITLAYTIGKANIVISNFSIAGWRYSQTANAPTYDVTFEDYTTVTLEYFDKDYNSIGATAPRNAGTYYVKATAAGNTNLNGYTTDFVQFTVAKASVSIDGVNDSYVESYNGAAFTLTGVKASNGATVTKVITKQGVDGTVDAIIGAGEYTITYTVAEGPNYLGATRTVEVTINKATVTISKPVIEGWTYGEAAKAPSAHFNETFAYGQINLKYFTDADCKNEITDLTNAGTYYVKAIFAGNDDLNAAASEATAFVVAQKAVTVPTVSNKPYNGQNQTSGLTAAEGYTVVDNGGTNVGPYTATVTLVSTNYIWKDGTSAVKELVYNITSIENTQEFEKTSYTATYGDLLKDIVKLPANVQGTWSIEGATEATTVGNAGTNTFKAIFEPDEVGNYNGRTVEITIVVAKKTVGKPIINPKEYTGDRLYSGLISNDLYTVVDDGGVDHGEYDVVLALVDADNYKWESTEDVSITLKFVISTAINAWVEGKLPTISSWEYESEGDHAGKATALHGDVLVEYKPADALDSAYSTELPEVPGNYVARFTTTDDNYTILTETINFSITKRVITPPKQMQSSFVYSGSLIKSDLSDGTGYAVIADEGRTNVGSFTATISLTSEHYVWNDGTTANKTFTYSITPATNTQDITVEYTATYGDLLKDIITLPTGIQGTWSIEGVTEATTVGNAGTQSFKAIFTPDATGNYNRRDVEITITVAKKTVNAPTEYTKEYTYTGSDITAVIPVESGLYTVSGNVAKNFGSYNATLTLTDSANYKWATTDAATTTVPYSIGKADVAVSITINGWTYGQAANAPLVSISKEFVGDVPYVVEYSADGLTWSTTVPTDADNYTVRVTVEENANYQVTAESVTEATFTIAKINTSITANEIYNFTYNGSAHMISATASNGNALSYTYEADGSEFTGVTNTGEYKVVITLAETDTHKGATVTVTVKVEKADVTISKPVINGWTYGESAKTPVASFNETFAQSSNGQITFKYFTDAACTAEIELPVNAGTYYVKAVFAGNDNLNEAESEAQSFTIAKAVVPVPSIANKDYNGQVQYSGLVSDIYTVTEAENPLNKGDYTVTLTLNTPANYAWTSVDNTSATATATYSILAVENTISVSIGNNAQWQYGTTEDVVNSYITVEVKYGGWTVAYRALGSTGEYTEGLPTKKGSYELKFTTTDPNCSIVSATRSVEILATSVAVPTIGNLTYNTTLQKPTVPAGLYTVVVNNGGTNVGTYSVELQLLDTDSSYWGEDTSDVANKTVTYEITKATVTLSGLAISNWNYNETASTPTVQMNLSVPYYFEYFADGAWSKTVPTKAGNYKVRAVVDKTDNYDAVTTDEVAFVINQATPSLTGTPTFGGGNKDKYYLNQFTYSYSGMGATHANANVPGAFTWGAPTFVANSGGYIELTFTPTDTANYKTVTTKYNINFVTVAVIDSTEYGSIEAALAAAVSGETVCVRPHDADLGPIYIKENVEIKSGVKLLLPYGVATDRMGRNQWTGDQPFFELHGGSCDYTNSNSYTSHNGGDKYRVHENNEGHYPSEQDPNKCIVKVILAAGKTITNKGILEIGGELSGGGAHAQYAGFTAGKHATLVLDAGAKIISENGSKIYAAGFIRESSANNGSEVIIQSGATLFQPYTIKDFRDGSYMAAAKNSMKSPYWVSPYNRFLMMNVSPKLTIYYGGALAVWASLFTGSTENNNTTTVTFIGSDKIRADATIVLNKSYSYLQAKYDPATEICDLTIYGGAKTQAMKLDIENVATVSTNDCFFPLTYHYNITLCKSDLRDANGNLLQGENEVALFEMGQRFKLMNGASLTIEEGVMVDINTLVVYETFVDNCAYHNAHYRYPNKPAAILTVNGELNCDYFGGKVYSNTEGAKVTINSGTSYTMYEITNISALSIFSSVNEWNTFTEEAKLVQADKTAIAPVKGKTWEYVNGVWETSISIHFDANEGDAVSSLIISTSDTVYPELPTPTRAHYIFMGWKDANGNIVSQGSALPANVDLANGITLTAQWTPQPYTLNFNFKYEGWEVGSEPANTLPGAIEFNVETASITLPIPTGTGTFVGWYKDAACTELIISISGAELLEISGGNATIYGLWTSKQFTIKFENDHFGDVPYDNDTAIYTPSQLPTASLPTIPDSYQTDVTINKYFEGWYYNGQKVTDFSFIDTSVSGEYTLTAKWIDKVSITYTANDQGVYTDLITNGSATLEYGKAYWYMSGTTIKLPNATANDSVIDDANKLHYFLSWTLNGAEFGKENANTDYSLSTDTVINIVWGTKTKISVTATKDADGSSAVAAKYAIKVSSTAADGGVYAEPSAVNNANATYYVIPGHYIKFTVSSSNGDHTLPTSWTEVGSAELSYNIHYRNKECITAGTLITLADGTQKKVEDLTMDDILLVFNHETGEYEAAGIIFIENDGWKEYNVITLTFSDGTTTKLIYEHAYFDLTLNKYVYITEQNHTDFIGHEFAMQSENGFERVTMTDATLAVEYTGCYSLVTVYHLNYFVDGLFSIPGGITGLFNIFEYGDDLVYDEEKMQADIEEYGLFTYEDFEEFLPYEFYVAFPASYLKVSIGKGLMTFDDIYLYIEQFLVKNGLM